MTVWLERQGHQVSRKRIQPLMRTTRLQTIYRRPRTSQPTRGYKVYPYLLGSLAISRPDQEWAADTTYIPMARGFLYLVDIMDWYNRYVVAWSLSNTLDAASCVEALEKALSKGKPEVFNTDQGGEAFTGLLERHQVRIGMDGRQGALHRQHLCTAGVAHSEVRRGVPESLLQRAGGQGRARRLLSPLHPKAPSGLGLPDTRRSVQPGPAAVR